MDGEKKSEFSEEFSLPSEYVHVLVEAQMHQGNENSGSVLSASNARRKSPPPPLLRASGAELLKGCR